MSPSLIANLQSPWFMVVIIILAIWSIIWKGLALWKAARQDSKIWFIIFLIVNTVGILDILYIYIFSKKSAEKNKLS